MCVYVYVPKKHRLYVYAKTDPILPLTHAHIMHTHTYVHTHAHTYTPQDEDGMREGAGVYCWNNNKDAYGGTWRANMQDGVGLYSTGMYE